jgi:DNA-binding transcriptional LysR family regulator
MAATLRQLRAYALLLEERNFTRAAAAMHLSQPAFSALIGGLEQSLGVRLFDRSKRHVAPTVEGADFEPAARRVLAEFDTAIAGVHDRASLRRGRVSLALLPSLAAGWLPDVLARYRASYPGITVDVADVLSEPCIERVTTMRADFALAAVRAETPELQAEVFCADDFHLVCRADHPLAKARAPVKLRDLAACPFIHLSRTSSVRQYLDAAFRPQAMDTVMEVDQLATVMGMVRAGLGISVVPALALFHFEQPEIATRPVPLPGLARRIFLVRRRDRSLSLAAQALHDLVLSERPPIARPKAAAARGRRP